VLAVDDAGVTLDVSGKRTVVAHDSLGPGRVRVEFNRLAEIDSEDDAEIDSEDDAEIDSEDDAEIDSEDDAEIDGDDDAGNDDAEDLDERDEPERLDGEADGTDHEDRTEDEQR
jgi:hypothetical protein